MNTKNNQTNALKKHAKLPVWNLKDLYPSQKDKSLTRDLHFIKNGTIKFEKKYRVNTDTIDVRIPKIKACFLVTFPVGIGLKQVLVIMESKSASYHILRAPAAPEPKATAIIENIASKRFTFVGAINNPTTQVKITNDITHGFIKRNRAFR